ncbi:hypothetical protein [Limnothrix redekei]|uniref:Uncharacterized protein n=1 Tax=Limnothrix redekei LRLZ20PSL1 TaxID=3112953 RepID=A0ABW7CE09_9CYAN
MVLAGGVSDRSDSGEGNVPLELIKKLYKPGGLWLGLGNSQVLAQPQATIARQKP